MSLVPGGENVAEGVGVVDDALLVGLELLFFAVDLNGDPVGVCADEFDLIGEGVAAARGAREILGDFGGAVDVNLDVGLGTICDGVLEGRFGGGHIA